MSAKITPIKGLELTLTRLEYRDDGIFSELALANQTWAALERSYNKEPKVKPGRYLCKRDMRRLKGMTKDFETFEITGVKGHWGILFHVGNYNKDSDGCVLVGQRIVLLPDGKKMISHSRRAFASFMDALRGHDHFYLTVLAAPLDSNEIA